MENKKILMIVESPNKVHTLSKFLPSNYVVMASVGHDMKLADTGKWDLGIDIDNGFKPNYIVDPGKKDVVNALKAEAKMILNNGGKIVLASDSDYEGEKISDEMRSILKIKESDYDRVTYNEITKDVVLDALAHPRKIDDNKVASAESRAILDKITGFRLSPISHKFLGALSVGRVQSATLKILVNREKEILSFVPEKFWEIWLTFTKSGKEYKAQYKGDNDLKNATLKDEKAAKKIYDECKVNSNGYIVRGIYSKDRAVKSKLPYDTPSFQQDVSAKLGISPKIAMQIAENLFAAAKITYIRTDSKVMSAEFAAKLKDFVIDTYGKEYYQPVKTEAKNALAQGAHECIRITDFNLTPEKFRQTESDSKTCKVYDLIYRRTVAASMSDCIMTDTIYPIFNGIHRFEYAAHSVKFPGYKAVYDFEGADDSSGKEDHAGDPKLINGEAVKEKNLELLTKETSGPQRYTEAGLVKAMTDLHIGRPSTTASIIAVLRDPKRGYTEAVGRTIKPTKLGMDLSEFLDQHFSDLINLSYTEEMEEKLDEIGEGKLDKLQFLNNFYKVLTDDIDKVKRSGMEDYNSKNVTDILCPKCKKNYLIVRRGKYGNFYACAGYHKDHCDFTAAIGVDGKPVVKVPETIKYIEKQCPKCGKKLAERTSRKGTIYHYCPSCKYMEFQDKAGNWNEYDPNKKYSKYKKFKKK